MPHTKLQPQLSPVWPQGLAIAVERGEGCYLYDLQGNAYLDFTSGIGVTNTGHCHPKVVEAIRQQAGLLLHGQATIVKHQPMQRLIEELGTIVPEKIDSFFFTNSGAEAIEGAVKLARHATGRPNIIVFQGGFHGRTVGTMALTTAKTIYRAGYQPLMSGVAVSPYPYAFRYRWSPEATTAWCLNELKHVLATQTAPHETAAILIEPLLGEGGYVVPTQEFIRGVREICDAHNILLIADEIQSGFGRTGKFFCMEHFGVAPDILVMAKGLASGLPLSCVASSNDLMKRWIPGSHGGTYGGNALACAAAVATVQVMREEGLVENAVTGGAYLQKALRQLQDRYSVIGDVRGLGLMIATEFTMPDGSPNPAVAKAVRQECLHRRLLLLTCGTQDHVIRWIPPLTVDTPTLQQGVTIFEEALKIATA